MAQTSTATLFAFLLVTSVLAAVASPASAGHGAENGNYTVNLPTESDHYPGEQGGKASIEHFAAGTQEAYEKAGAPDGFEKMSWIVIQSQDIDFSSCSTADTQAFGIDRDNDNPGTNTDVDLLQYREGGTFGDNFISVNFYEGDELAAPPEEDRGGKSEGRADGDSNAELYPDDEIVARQQECYVMPTEPGWYQIDGKLNGTNWQGSFAEVHVPSHYFYVCKCEDEQAAREKLGPPPSEQGGDSTEPTATPTPDSQATATPATTATPTPTATPEPQATATPEPQDTATATPSQATPTATDAAQQASGGSGGDGGTNADGGGQNAAASSGGNQDRQRAAQSTARPLPTTPTIAEGPGFGVGLALLALAGAALLALRRDT